MQRRIISRVRQCFTQLWDIAMSEWVGRVGGENTWKEVKVVIFMFKDMVVKLRSNNGGIMFF
jgi:hypothetical protein